MMIDAILWLKSHGMMRIELGDADQQADRRTDTPAYRDARTHLKRSDPAYDVVGLGLAEWH